MIEKITKASPRVFYEDDGKPTVIPLSFATGELQFRMFTQLWGIAALFHMAHSSIFDEKLNLALLTCAAIYSIFRPSVPSLIALAVFQLIDAFIRMPFTTNHWIFTAFVNLTILQAFIYQSFKNKTYNIRGAAWMESFAPVVRWELITLYFFAAFHKLNSAFFDPSTSCATDLLRAQHLDALVTLTPEMMVANAYFTVLLEFLIPILLCIGSTRNIGIALGLFFHALLSYSTYNAFYDFSSMVFAVYFLFANPGLSLRVYEIASDLKRSLRKTLSQPSLLTMVAVTFIIVALAAAIIVGNQFINNFRGVHLYVFWTAYCILVGYALISYLRRKKSVIGNDELSFSLPHPMFVAIPIIVFLNGLSPYLGLKTENSYAMFSNLKTEGGSTNHYIIPASIQIFDYQKEFVNVHSSSDPLLQKYAREGKSIVLFEFKNLIYSRKPKTVQYSMDGETHVFRWEERHETAALAPNPPVLARLMKFRVFNESGQQPCGH